MPGHVEQPAADMVHTWEGLRPADRRELRRSVVSWLNDHVAQRPDAPYLTTVLPSGDQQTLSYREVDHVSSACAGWLRRELGLGPGTRVAFAPVNDAASVVLILGLLKTSCATLLLNPADPVARRTGLLEALDPAVTVTVAGEPDPHPTAVRMPDISRLMTLPRGAPADPIDSTADALYFGTSGSTAASKLVAQTHYNSVANGLAVIRHHGLKPGDRVLACLPIHHVNGLHFTVFGTLMAGAHVLLAGRFEPLRYPQLLEGFAPRIASVVPTILEMLLNTWQKPAVPSAFEYFVSAAAPLSRAVASRVHNDLGARILQGYGLTETTNFSATVPRGLDDAAYRRLMLDVDIPGVGVAVHGNEVAVLDAAGTRLPPGEIGEIAMRGHNVMSRYVNNEVATAEAFRGGWFRSGDLGFLSVDGETGLSTFTLTGREKNIAKVAGEAVSLEEIERFLLALPSVEDAACGALPHSLLGEEIMVAVVLRLGSQVTDLSDAMRGYFASTALPRHIFPVQAVPRTPTGKIKRPELAEQFRVMRRERQH